MHKRNLKTTVAIDPKSARATTINNGHNLNPSRDSKPLVALPNLRTAKRILSNPKFGMVVVQTNSLNQFKTTQHGKLVRRARQANLCYKCASPQHHGRICNAPPAANLRNGNKPTGGAINAIIPDEVFDFLNDQQKA